MDLEPVGVACSGEPADPASFSGIPRALLDAFNDLGVDARPIRAGLPATRQRRLQLALSLAGVRPAAVREAGLRAAVRTNQARLLASGTLERTRSAAAASAVRRQRVAACIQFGTDFILPASVKYITYDDQTVLQAMGSYGYDYATRLRPRDVDALVARQRSVFHGAAKCCATTHWAAQSIMEDYGVPPGRVRVVGIGATNLPAQVVDRDWSAPRFLFIGKDWTRKNGPAVLRAFAAVRREHPDARLDVVGGHPALDEPGVTGHGMLAPGAPESRRRIAELQAAATCFVMPSLHEPSAIAHVEAASAGIGSIGTVSGGCATLIGDGGLVVDPSDDQAIVEAMLAFADGARARAWGALAAERAGRFTWTAVGQRLLDALHERESAPL